jgi:flavodoxin
MKRVRVIYATKTNHSRKIADAVAAALGVQALNVASHPSFGEADLLFIVGGLYGSDSLPELTEYISGLSSAQVKKAALITSSVSNAKGQDTVRSLLESKGISVIDEYRCYGAFLFIRLGHPNKTEVQNAADFAVRLAGKES